jgi:YHS domain-containing protein
MKSVYNLVGLFMALAITTYSQPSQPAAKLNVDETKLALAGYDPVSYVREKKAVKGKTSFTAESDGATYRFSSQANKDLFLKAPSAYKPQYGGWCAYAMGATGEKVEVDPETFKIIDGKLYLFYNKFFNNTRDSWNKNETELKAKADKNWSKLNKTN